MVPVCYIEPVLNAYNYVLSLFVILMYSVCRYVNRLSSCILFVNIYQVCQYLLSLSISVLFVTAINAHIQVFKYS